MTYAIMGLVLLFMAFILIYKAKLTKDTSHFFNLTNTTAMRGFWCIIVILVHIPAVYQNRIQDLMGSFAYIGVTVLLYDFGLWLESWSKKESGFNEGVLAQASSKTSDPNVSGECADNGYAPY